MTLRELNQVVISVGSNINPAPNIEISKDYLSKETEFIYAATAIETAPVGYLEQSNFLNTAFLVATPLSYEEFNLHLKSIEDRMGRERGPIKAGPRTIDLDIVIWNGCLLTDDYYSYDYVSIPVNQVIKTKNLTTNIASKPGFLKIDE
jgi:2-amino-4-hydroxy-6-hydroxymethyldihydropteridine diphosphokinase